MVTILSLPVGGLPRPIPEIRTTGAGVATVSVDPSAKSSRYGESCGHRFRLGVISSGVSLKSGISRTRGRGAGITNPVDLINDRDRAVRYSTWTRSPSRVPAAEIARTVGPAAGRLPVRRKVCIPRLSDFGRTIRQQESDGGLGFSQEFACYSPQYNSLDTSSRGSLRNSRPTYLVVGAFRYKPWG